MYGGIGKLSLEGIRARQCWRSQRVLSAAADNTSLYLHNSSDDTASFNIHLRFLDVTMYVFMYVHHHICLNFKYGPRNRGSFVHSQSIQKENKRTFRLTNKV